VVVEMHVETGCMYDKVRPVAAPKMPYWRDVVRFAKMWGSDYYRAVEMVGLC
jgi:hypothetical protein